ncbi:membrane protein insertase YidC [soil metagenome]
MEKRVLLAVFLMSAVILLTNLLFPPPEPGPQEGAAGADTAVATAPAAVVERAALPMAPATQAVEARVVEVRSPLYRYAFATRGAALLEAELVKYPSYTRPGQPVQLIPEGTLDFLAHRVIVGRDTLDLRNAVFQADASSLTLQEGEGPRELRFTYGGNGGFGAEITYTFLPDSYLVGVRGRLLGLGSGALLLTEIGPGLAAHEDPAHRSERQQAVVARGPQGIENLVLEKQRAPQVVDGPLVWAGVKDKYFLASLVAADTTRFGGVIVQPLPEDQVVIERGQRADTLPVPRARAAATLPVGADGQFAFNAYLGPQDYGRLSAVGHGLQEVNPYGYRWLRPVIRPIAGAILWVLNVLHNSLGIGYGWVLVLFGVMMRVVLWPLNAKAMRAQMKNMAVQPMMQEIREKYKDDPQKQQQEMIRLYKEHGFNPVAGCLPLLIPFPVLITLFFVFQDSIAFRGESFFWLPDLSLADPLYILPIFLVISMFLLQWISARMSGMEQNPQMKMMMYFMPLAIGFIFFMLPSGLNLYYATTNVATLPQQILISKERKKAQEAMKEQQKPAPRGAPVPSGGGGRKPGARRAKRQS